MTPQEAVWVREHVWTGVMRKEHRSTPAFFASCPCLYGKSWHCQHGKCLECHRAAPLRSPEGYITNKREEVLSFSAPYQHPHETATGAHPTRNAMVWLADRACRWVCPCTCHQGDAEPQESYKRATVGPARPARYELVPLPGLEAVGQ